MAEEGQVNFGYVYNLSGSPVYACVWEGAKDSTSNNSVSALINGLIAAGYTPRGYTAQIPKLNVLNPFTKDAFDAVFTADVKSALISWQTANRINPDGVAGPDTWHALLGSSTITRNCRPCAGNYPYGTQAPENCKSNLPAKKDEGGGGGSWWPWAVGGAVVVGAAVWGVLSYRKSRSKRAN